MAINPLYGYDTGQYGYVQANTPSATRKYPAWMTDPNARGIGVAQQFTAPSIAPIDIPRGDGLGGFNDQTPVPQPLQQGFGGGQPSYVSEGGGAGGGGSLGFANDAPSNFAPSGFIGDLVNMLGLNIGDYGPTTGGRAGYGIEVAPAGYGGGVAGEPGTPGFGGGTATSGSTGATGFGGGPAGEIGGVGGIDGGGDIGGMGGGMGAGGDPGMGGVGGMYRGGVVTRNKLSGPNPPGPDDGYAALNTGEGVLTAKALRYYGDGLVDRLNKLQVPKSAFGKK